MILTQAVQAFSIAMVGLLMTVYHLGVLVGGHIGRPLPHVVNYMELCVANKTRINPGALLGFRNL
jgi:hypothetical protein